MRHIRTTFPFIDAVDQAFECVYWEGAGDEDVEAFASHWGGLDLEHFRLALEKGTGEEQILAIFALGLTADPEMANLIAPFLFQTSRMQRVASAICLGLMKDTRAFPVLEQLVLDGLDLEEYTRAYLDREGYTRAYQEEYASLLSERAWCGVFRWHAIQLLEDWESPSLIPTLKQAFTALWRVQQKLHPYGWSEVSNYDALAGLVPRWEVSRRKREGDESLWKRDYTGLASSLLSKEQDMIRVSASGYSSKKEGILTLPMLDTVL